MKKYLIGLCLAVSVFGGIFAGSVEANFVEKIADKTGSALRDVEEFNLKMQYYLRPYEEGDLTFNQWSELYGYGTSGRGVIPSGEFKLPKAEMFGSIGANTDMRLYILNILEWVLSFLGIIAITVVIFAGYTYVVGGEENNEKAKKMIMYAAIGILVILSSYALVNTLITQTLEGGDNFEVIQNRVSSGEVVTGGEIQAVCVDAEGVACADSMGVGGWAVPAYNEIRFVVTGINVLPGLSWNFGDGVLYPAEDEAGAVTRSFSDDNKWYQVAVMGETQTEDGPRPFVGQSRVWVGEVAMAQFKVSSPGKAKVGQQVSFDAGGSNVVAGTLDKYIWSCEGSACGSDFAENAMASATHGKKQFYHTFNEEGVVTVSLVVKAKFGASEIVSKPFNMEFSIGDTPAVAGETLVEGEIDFNMPKTVRNGVELAFAAKGDDSYTYEWVFPDDVQDGGMAVFAFDELGVNEVTLNATDSEGEDVATKTKSIVVTSRDKPIAIIKINDELILPSSKKTEIDLDGDFSIESASCDEAETCGDEAGLELSWKWNGKPVLFEYLAEIPKEEGSHQVVLEVVSTADPAKKDSRIVNVVVAGSAPKVSITVEPYVALGEGQYKVTAEIGETENVSRYRFEVLEFGKVVEAQMVNSKERKITTFIDLSEYEGTHDYTFRVEVTGDNGMKGTAQEIESGVVIPENAGTNEAPVTEIISNPGNVGSTRDVFRFSTETTDKDGDTLSYKWTFPNNKKVIGKTATHRFRKPGEFVVKVEVSDKRETVSDTYIVRISEDIASGRTSSNPGSTTGSGTSAGTTYHGVNRTPMVQISGVNPGDAGDTKTKFSFFSNATDPDMDDLVYEWNFGDERTSTMKNVTHIYKLAGDYKLTLRVSDGEASREAKMTVRVVNEGEVIPESTVPSYEPEYHSSALSADQVRIISGDKNLESFSEEMGRVKDEKKGLLEYLEQQIAEKETELAACIASEGDCEEIKKELEELKAQRLKLLQEIDMLDLVQAKIDALAKETDPAKQKLLNDEINALLAQLHEMDENFSYDFATIRGNLDTTFFLYGQIDFETDRPIWMEWDTGDGRTFGGQDVAWKYAEKGLYEVVMTVSDGTASVTNSLTIKVE